MFSSSIFCIEIENLHFSVVSKLRHHLPAFTQGLSIHEGKLYESTGLYGQSSLRELDMLTGKILQKIPLPFYHFAEGIACHQNQLIQLTWQSGKALVYDSRNLIHHSTFSYQGEGWGLCPDEGTVWMSNGSSLLTQRNATTFEPIRNVEVQMNGKPLKFLNDLECVGDHLYANVWYKNWIARIDKLTGEVDGIIDTSYLLTEFEKANLSAEDVLNGIAYSQYTNTFFLTGKNWPWIFEVKLKFVQQ